MNENTADCHRGGHGPHDDDQTCSCACHHVLGRRADYGMPWAPEDPDEVQSPEALLAYWRQANVSERSQKQLVSDRWLLWRFARDAATALDEVLRGQA